MITTFLKMKSDLDFHLIDFELLNYIEKNLNILSICSPKVSQLQGSDVKRPPSLAFHLGRWIIPIGIIQLPGQPQDAYFASRG